MLVTLSFLKKVICEKPVFKNSTKKIQSLSSHKKNEEIRAKSGTEPILVFVYSLRKKYQFAIFSR